MTEEPEPEVSEYEEIWATLEDPFGEWTEDDMKELYHLVRGRILQKALKVVMDQMGSLADKSLALCPLTKSMDMEEHYRLQGNAQGQHTIIDNLLTLAGIEG